VGPTEAVTTVELLVVGEYPLNENVPVPPGPTEAMPCKLRMPGVSVICAETLPMGSGVKVTVPVPVSTLLPLITLGFTEREILKGKIVTDTDAVFASVALTLASVDCCSKY
jgi:hypothetical protein